MKPYALMLATLSLAATGLAACAGGGGSPATPVANTSSFRAPAAALLPDGELAGVAAKTRTYTIGTTCQITYCSNAILSAGKKPVGTISYAVGLGNGGYFGDTTFGGSFTFEKTKFDDFHGTFTSGGVVTYGGTTYTQWKLYGKMSGGRDAVYEVFDVRGHSGRGGGNTIINTSGKVVTPLVTPRPTPSPKPTPPPTPQPSPSDDGGNLRQ
jgi:hypothetical protein